MQPSRSTFLALLLSSSLVLSACGGGGGDDGDTAQAGDPIATGTGTGTGTGTDTGTGTGTGGTTSTGETLIAADTQAAANARYAVNDSGAGPITVTLPETAGLAIGSTVTVRGLGATPWQIAQNAGQTVLTNTLGGNVTPGTTWTPSTMAPMQWHWVASNPTGEVLVAADNPGSLHISRDGGTTWQVSADTPTTANWIGADISADGQHMVAVAFGGNMYRSTNGGANWTLVSSGNPAINLAGQQYEAVTISDDGQRIAAVILDGPAVVSTNGGTTWQTGTSAGASLVQPWRSIDSSPDGTTLVAVTQATAGPPAVPGQVYVSQDAGLTWTPRTVSVGGSPVAEGWYRVRLSRVGNVIALASNGVYAGGERTGLYLSRDLGATWTRSGAPGADYTGIALSEDASVIAATISDGVTGSVQYSRDAGTTFSALTVPSGADTNFRNVAMDRFGDKLSVVTGTFTGALPGRPGQIYTSIGNRTSTGGAGIIAGGGQGESVTLTYEGNGVFRVTASEGSFQAR